jgi:hypothetical protein
MHFQCSIASARRKKSVKSQKKKWNLCNSVFNFKCCVSGLSIYIFFLSFLVFRKVERAFFCFRRVKCINFNDFRSRTPARALLLISFACFELLRIQKYLSERKTRQIFPFSSSRWLSKKSKRNRFFSSLLWLHKLFLISDCVTHIYASCLCIIRWKALSSYLACVLRDFCRVAEDWRWSFGGNRGGFSLSGNISTNI